MPVVTRVGALIPNLDVRLENRLLSFRWQEQRTHGLPSLTPRTSSGVASTSLIESQGSHPFLFPHCLFFVERCSRTIGNSELSMRAVSISRNNARSYLVGETIFTFQQLQRAVSLSSDRWPLSKSFRSALHKFSEKEVQSYPTQLHERAND